MKWKYSRKVQVLVTLHHCESGSYNVRRLMLYWTEFPVCLRHPAGLYEDVPDHWRSMQGGSNLPWCRDCKLLHIVWIPSTFEVFPGKPLTAACEPLFQDGVIIENMHDIPYSFSVGPEVCACMTAVCTAVRSVCPSLPLGVQILSSANQQALAIALASGSGFTSVELYVCDIWGCNHLQPKLSGQSRSEVFYYVLSWPK